MIILKLKFIHGMAYPFSFYKNKETAAHRCCPASCKRKQDRFLTFCTKNRGGGEQPKNHSSVSILISIFLLLLASWFFSVESFLLIDKSYSKLL